MVNTPSADTETVVPFAAVSAITIGITALVDANVETAEEIREAAEEAKKKLDVFTEKIKENTEENQELKDLEPRFRELIKGVDVNTGMNISLDTTEWEEYQNILKRIIEISNDLYASYDAQGNIIAKSHSGFVDLNNAIAQTTEANKQDIVQNARLHTDGVAARRDVVKEKMLTAEEESMPIDNKDNDWGLELDDFYLTANLMDDPWLEKNGKTAYVDEKYRDENAELTWELVGEALHFAIKEMSQGLGLMKIFGGQDGSFFGIGAHGAIGDMAKDNIEAYVRAALEVGYTHDEIVEGLKKDLQITSGYFATGLDDDQYDQLVTNVVAAIESEESKYGKVTEAYSKQLTNDMITALQASTLYLNFDQETQSFLQNLVQSFKFDPYQKDEYGNYVLNENGERIKKDDTAITNDTRLSAEAAERLVDWTASNTDKSNYIKDFNVTNASSSDWAIRASYIKDMLDYVSRVDTNNDGQVDDNDTKNYEIEIAAAEANGFVIDKENLIYDENGTIIGYQTHSGDTVDAEGNPLDIMDVAQDQREVLWYQQDFNHVRTKLIGRGMDYDDFSFGELQLLDRYKDDSRVKSFITEEGEDLDRQGLVSFLQQVHMGQNAQASEYFSLLNTEVDAFSGKTEDLAKILNTTYYQGLYSVDMLRQFADNLGMMDSEGNVLDSFGEVFSFIGDINVGLMTTSKTLTDIQAQYQDINDAITDINDNGKISSDNLEKILETYPHLIQYLGDTDTMLEKLNIAAGTYDTKVIASIKGKITGNKDALMAYVDGNESDQDGAFDGVVSASEQSDLKMFGTIDAMHDTTSRIYHKDSDTGQWVLNDDYQYMPNTEEDYKYDSWSKIIAEEVFDIDTASKDKQTVDNELFVALRDRMVSTGMIDANAADSWTIDNLDQMVGMFADQLKDPTVMMFKQNVLDAQAQVNAIKTAMDLEDEYVKQQIDDYVGNLKTIFQAGDISGEQYIGGLTDALNKLQSQGNATTAEISELKEEIEDTKFDNLTEQFKEGAMSAEKFNQELSKLAKNNVVGEADWEDMVDAAIGANDQTISINDKNISMLEMSSVEDFNTKRNLQSANIAAAQKKLAEIEAAGRLEHGDNYDPESDPKYIAAKEGLYNEVKEFTETFSEQKSFLENELNNGTINHQEYINSLQDMIDSGELTAEQVKEFGEAIEDVAFELAKTQFTDGKIKGVKYRSLIMNQIQNNVSGSEDERRAIQEYISSYNTEVSISETKASLLADNDFIGKSSYLAQDIDTLMESLAFMEAAGLQNSEEYYKNVQRIVEKKKEQLELEKQRYEYEIKQSGEVLDAYSNILSYGMDELKKRQEDINDMYDDEISKLQDINDQKQRSIELTKLEQELENAKKEKVRVYTAGVGFTYQQNKVKVKEAKQNLDAFNDKQKISDLQHAQEAQNKLIEDEIKRLQDILDYISNIKETAQVTASLMDLKKRNIVPQDETISDAINQITQKAVNGKDGKIASLGTEFDNYANSYITNSTLLNQYNDELEGKLDQIVAQFTTHLQYATDKELVNDLSSQIATKINSEDLPVANIKNNVQTITDKLSKLIGDRDFNTFVSDFKTQFGSVTIGNMPDLNVAEHDYSDQLAEANKHLENMQALLAASVSGKKTQTNGQWGGTNGKKYANRYTGYSTLDTYGNRWYVFENTETGKHYWTRVAGDADSVVSKDTQYFSQEELHDLGFHAADKRSFSSGIENGPVTYTGLAMLHGSPSSPEYVLNSEQAGTLLKNLATMTMNPYQAPKVDSYNHSGNSTVYQFSGDLHLPNVQRPDQFFSELMKQANAQFPTIKQNYR